MARTYTPTSPPEDIEARKQKRFLKVLLQNGGFVEAAIREVHTSRRWLNTALDNDPSFNELYTAIRDQNNEKIEQEVYRRAVIGNDKPLVHQGKLTGDTVKEYSDNLLMFYAKANMPEKYRDLPQKGKEISDEELNDRIGKYMRKRKDDTPDQPTDLIN